MLNYVHRACAHAQLSVAGLIGLLYLLRADSAGHLATAGRGSLVTMRERLVVIRPLLTARVHLLVSRRQESQVFLEVARVLYILHGARVVGERHLLRVIIMLD